MVHDNKCTNFFVALMKTCVFSGSSAGGTVQYYTQLLHYCIIITIIVYCILIFPIYQQVQLKDLLRLRKLNFFVTWGLPILYLTSPVFSLVRMSTN